MRAAGVLPLLLLVALCAAPRAAAEVKAVKLCGREFLRAVVYTCGGSRWRRLLGGEDADRATTGDRSGPESLGPPGSEPSRRDINNILTTVCCQVGCRKSDLAFLC